MIVFEYGTPALSTAMVSFNQEAVKVAQPRFWCSHDQRQFCGPLIVLHLSAIVKYLQSADFSTFGPICGDFGMRQWSKPWQLEVLITSHKSGHCSAKTDRDSRVSRQTVSCSTRFWRVSINYSIYFITQIF